MAHGGRARRPHAHAPRARDAPAHENTPALRVSVCVPPRAAPAALHVCDEHSEKHGRLAVGRAARGGLGNASHQLRVCGPQTTEVGVNRFHSSLFSHATRRALRCSTHPPDSQCAIRCTHDRCFVCPVYSRGICVLLCTPGCVGLMVCGPRACCLSRGPLPPPFVSRVFVLGVLFPHPK